MENHEIIKRPLISEKLYDMVELENKIAFEVRKEANKYMIKRAVEELYNVKVAKVRTLITPFGEKRAICTLTPQYSAYDLATDLSLFG